MINRQKADEFFRKEIDSAQIERSAHYTFRDGFRLGFGIFCGFLLGSVILIGIVWLLGSVFKIG